MSSTKPSSTRPPKPPTTISPSAIISEGASMTGTHAITISDNTVIHPRAKLISSQNPISIGKNCIIYERCLIGSSPSTTSSSSSSTTEGGSSEQLQPRGEIHLEDNVVIETGTKIEKPCFIGEGTYICMNARVGRGAVIGRKCKIGAWCEVLEGEVVPDHTIVYGTGQRRLDRFGLMGVEMDARGRQIDLLRGLVPSNLAKWRT